MPGITLDKLMLFTESFTAYTGNYIEEADLPDLIYTLTQLNELNHSISYLIKLRLFRFWIDSAKHSIKLHIESSLRDFEPDLKRKT
jgi:hypothetical protein